MREHDFPRGGHCAVLRPLFSLSTLTTKKKKNSEFLLFNFTQAGGMEQVGSAYAAALVETAQAKGSLDAVHADVDTLQVRNWEEENFLSSRRRRLWPLSSSSSGVADRRRPPQRREMPVARFPCLSCLFSCSSPGALMTMTVMLMHPR